MKQVMMNVFEFVKRYRLERLTVSKAIKEYNAYCTAISDILAEEPILYI